MGQGVNLVDEPKPLASLHPLFEGRQHPFRPDLRFHPVPPGSNRPGVLSFSCLLSPFRHCRRSLFLGLVRHVSTFLRSLRSRPVTALLCYYGRSDSCPLRRGRARVSSQRPPVRLLRGQVSLIHALGLLAIPSPTTCAGPALPGHVTHWQVGPRPHPLVGSSPHRNPGLRHCTAGSPPRAGRIEFSSHPHGEGFLRTGRSPPAAAHPLSRRRSCSRLQVYVEPGEDFHPSSQVRSQAHSAVAQLPPLPTVRHPRTKHVRRERRRQAGALQGGLRPQCPNSGHD
jgi:hypothetical protein